MTVKESEGEKNKWRCLLSKMECWPFFKITEINSDYALWVSTGVNADSNPVF